MGIKTEDFASIPPKEMTAGIQWLSLLDSFDPKSLDEKYINECARRNPYETCYRWEQEGLAKEPIEERLRSSNVYAEFDRRDLEGCVRRIEAEGLTPTLYKNARQALIKAIGQKGAAEYNRREYERLGEEGRKKQIEEHARWQQDRDRKRKEEEEEYNRRLVAGEIMYVEPTASMHEKVVMIRKGVLGSDGKPLTQRQFAKYIGYPINKYVEAEKTDRWTRRSNGDEESEVEYELLEKLIMVCHANPYWLFDEDCDADYAEYEENEIVAMGDAPCVYAKPDVILRWIEAGKQRCTRWESGCI